MLLTNDVTVPPGGSLSIAPGTVVLVGGGFSIRATNAIINGTGTGTTPVYFLPADGTAAWGGLLVSGSNGRMTLKHAEIAAGAVQVLNGSTGLLEDTTLRHYMVADPPIAYAENAASITLRRCHLTHYFETHFVTSLTTIEDCLLEYMTSDSSDAIDFDTVPAGSAVRRCTIRHGTRSNTDAVDLGTGCQGTVIEDCHLYDMNDKGVSIGEGSAGAVVRNCLIDHVGIWH